MEAKSFVFGLAFAVLVVVSAASNDTVTYAPKPGEGNGSVVDGPKELKSVKCYDCSFYIRGTEREGNEACEFIDPLVNEPAAGMVECNGYCVKQIMTQNALMSYLYVSRYCHDECDEETTEHYGNDLITTCCTDDYCNAAMPTTAVTMTTATVATVAAILSVCGWY